MKQTKSRAGQNDNNPGRHPQARTTSETDPLAEHRRALHDLDDLVQSTNALIQILSDRLWRLASSPDECDNSKLTAYGIAALADRTCKDLQNGFHRAWDTTPGLRSEADALDPSPAKEAA